MFSFVVNKYKKQIENLEHQIENMTWEWTKEKELYDDEMQKIVYKQKVDFVIGDLDVVNLKEIHRPIYGLTKEDAHKIADMVKRSLEEQGIFSSTSFHWRTTENCFVIDVHVMS